MDEIKVTYVLNVLNGEPFIHFQLKSIYDFAFEIIIVEGAYEKFSFAANNGRSTDNTIEIINDFPDPHNKIKLILNEGYYEDRTEMCNECTKYVNGNVIWQIDVDEFYFDETHLYVKEMFEVTESLDRISFNFLDIFGSLRLKVDGLDDSKLQSVRRVHRFNKGDSWSTQRPPTLVDSNDVAKVIRKEHLGDEMEKLGHKMFNLTMLFKSQILDKYNYYFKKGFTNDTQTWYENSIKNYAIRLNVLNISDYLTSLSLVEEKLPPIVYDLNEYVIDSVSCINYVDDSLQFTFASSSASFKFNELVKKINTFNTTEENIFYSTLSFLKTEVAINRCFNHLEKKIARKKLRRSFAYLLKKAVLMR
jgi:hypothetical protein